jgi:hypothetical protein
MFIPVAIKKINMLISSHGFVRVISIGNGVAELDFGNKIATVGFMGNVFWSEKE